MFFVGTRAVACLQGVQRARGVRPLEARVVSTRERAACITCAHASGREAQEKDKGVLRGERAVSAGGARPDLLARGQV